MKKEDVIVRKVTEKLKNKLDKENKLKEKISIDHHVNVLKDVTIMPHPKKGSRGIPRFCLTFGDAEQDIVVYRKYENIVIPFDNKYIRKATKSFSPKKNANHFKHIIIPLIIFEFKYGNVTTHTLTNYSALAQQIKDKMPEITYCIVLINVVNSTREKELRHGRYFDWIIPLHVSTELTDNSIERVANGIYEQIIKILKYRAPLLFS